MFQPKISIIIPVYNGSNYLKDAIQSALNQTYKNIEVLVINDGSNDNGQSEKIALSFWEQIKYFYKENGGVSTALNLWISEAQWDYISWLSHDDLYYPEKIKLQVQFLEKKENKNIIIYSNLDIIDSTGKIVSKSNLNFENTNETTFLYDLITQHTINGCTLLIPKSIFKSVGDFDKNLRTVQDYDMWIRLYKYIPFEKLDIPLIQSRHHPQQWARHPDIFIRMMQEEYHLYSSFIKDVWMKKIRHYYSWNTFWFFINFIIKYCWKIFLILPLFIYIWKFQYGRKLISKIRWSL